MPSNAWLPSIPFFLVGPTYMTECAMLFLLPFIINPLGAPSQVSGQARMLTYLPLYSDI